MRWRMRLTVAGRDAGAMRLSTCPGLEYQYEDRVSGRGAAWLARPSGGRKVESSNLSGPTNRETARLPDGSAGVSF
jgi:hypothetical protein